MPVHYNRIKVFTSTTGTGALTLGSAVAGFQDFSTAGVDNGDTVRYVIEDGDDWEIGTGQYNSLNNTLTRGPSETSTGGSTINLTGNAEVFLTATAEDIQSDVSITGGTLDGVTIGSVSPASGTFSEIIGDLTGNADTADLANESTKLSAPRDITIGNTTRSFDGTQNVLWTRDDVGIWPVGSVYIQFPGKSTPSTLFGGSWSRIYDNEGVFFRTEGNDASSFGGGIQSDQMQRITGSMQPNSGELFPNRSGNSTAISRDGVFGGTTLGQNVNTSVNSGGRSILRLDFDSSNSSGAKVSSSVFGETRPRNRTIRVWERTS